jgi:Transcription factor WhiB
MTLSRPPDWSEDAACLGLATRIRDPWTPGEHLTPEETAFELHLARRICSGCLVRVECASDALRRLPIAAEHSMRGGLTPDELIDLAKQLHLPHRQRAQHGTRSRYVAGCRCTDCRAAHATYEHERRLWAGARRRQRFADLVFAHLTEPRGRGRHRAEAGQLLLFTDGLPTRLWKDPAA